MSSLFRAVAPTHADAHYNVGNGCLDFGIGSDAATKELATCRGLPVDLVSALLSGICIAAYPTAFLAAALIPFGVPWFLLILCGSFWGFTSQPESLGRHSLSPGGDAVTRKQIQEANKAREAALKKHDDF